jgi:hypothetical protein
MLITGECRKCRERAIFDVGSLSKEEVEAWMKKSDFGECAAGGWHVELGKKTDYFALDWSKTFDTVEKAKEYNQAMLKARVTQL